MIFVLWLLFTPFHSHGLFIPPSTTATGTTRTPELASLLTTPQVEVGAQIVLDHRTLATWDYIGGEASPPKACSSPHTYTSTDLNERCRCRDGIECEEHDKICINQACEKCGTLGEEDCESNYTVLSCPSDTPSCARDARSSCVGSTSTVKSPGWDKTHETASATSAAPTVPENPPALSKTSDAEPESSLVKRSGDDGKLSKGDIIAIVIPSIALLVTIVVGWWEKQLVQWLLTCGFCGNRKSVHDQSLWKTVWKKLRFWK